MRQSLHQTEVTIRGIAMLKRRCCNRDIQRIQSHILRKIVRGAIVPGACHPNYALLTTKVGREWERKDEESTPSSSVETNYCLSRIPLSLVSSHSRLVLSLGRGEI